MAHCNPGDTRAFCSWGGPQIRSAMAEKLVQGFHANAARAVFISYASQDKAVADAVCRALEHAGISCWIAPRDVVPGEFYAESIVHAIDSARALVLVLSEHGADSQHVLREVERASSKRHPVVSLRIDNAPLPAGLEYFLNSSQWLDAQAAGVERSLPRLIEAVRIATSQPQSAAQPEARPVASARAGMRPMIMLASLAAVIAAAVGYVVVGKFNGPNHHPATLAAAAPAAAPVSDKSIAVLPFVDMSEKHDQEYFSDGLSEELIDHLAHNPDLKVIARTSSFAFKGKNEDMRSIAAQLGVAHLLEGSVRKSGSEMRVTAQLIRASDGVHLWSEIYDRKLTDIFKVQDEISSTVARALNVSLSATSAAVAPPAARETENIAAYNLLLQGNYFFWRGDNGDDDKAVGYLLQAIKVDPSYAHAWAKLARVYAWQGFFGELTPAEGARKGQEAAERALALDANSAEAYYARANVYRLILGDWNASIADNERAAALDPHGEVGDNARANILSLRAVMSGRMDDVIAWERKRLERDPLDIETTMDLALFTQAAGRLDESAAISRRLLDLNPHYEGANAQYAITLLLQGKNPEALVAANKEPDESSRLLVLACAYWALGRRAESDATLAAFEREFADRKAYEIGAVYAFRGQADAAFTWMDRAIQQRKGSLVDMKTYALLRSLRADPRYEALRRKSKLLA